MKKTRDCQHSKVVALNGPGLLEEEEEAIVDGARASSFIFYSKNSTGLRFLLSPVANSGPIQYSGSISSRSNSSATSAGSFTFPVLQSEWNSSPVKMAKADRWHLGKHRGWRMG